MPRPPGLRVIKNQPVRLLRMRYPTSAAKAIFALLQQAIVDRVFVDTLTVGPGRDDPGSGLTFHVLLISEDRADAFLRAARAAARAQ